MRWINYLTYQSWSWFLYSRKYTWKCLCPNGHTNNEYLMWHITNNESLFVWFISVWFNEYLTYQWWNWLVYSSKYTWKCLCPDEHTNIEYLMRHIIKDKSLLVWFISVWWIKYLTNQWWSRLVYSSEYTWDCLCPDRHKNIEYLM